MPHDKSADSNSSEKPTIKVSVIGPVDEREREALLCGPLPVVLQQYLVASTSLGERDEDEPSVDLRFHSLNDFQPLLEPAKVVLPAIAALLGAYIQSRVGRKLKVKVGDIEVEATQMKEEDVLR